MFKILMNGILTLLMKLVEIILWPINTLIGALFPDLSQYISGVMTLLANLLNGIAFVANLFPPIFKSLVIVTLTALIYYYTIYWSYTAITKAWTLIQRIKFW